MINLQNVGVKYGKKVVLSGVNLQFNGGILSVLGENGSGKTTLLKAILGTINFGGKITINGENLGSLSPKKLSKILSYIPQSNFTPFNYKAIEIVLMGRIGFKGFFDSYNSEDYAICEHYLKMLGIFDLKDENFLNLSGGQRQLMLIARALSSNAKTLIMDEPISGLSFGNQIRLLEMVKKFAQNGYNFIITTHHPRHANFLGGELIFVKNGTISQPISSENFGDCEISSLYGIDYKKYKEIL